jgi:hypothetical protein
MKTRSQPIIDFSDEDEEHSVHSDSDTSLTPRRSKSYTRSEDEALLEEVAKFKDTHLNVWGNVSKVHTTPRTPKSLRNHYQRLKNKSDSNSKKRKREEEEQNSDDDSDQEWKKQVAELNRSLEELVEEADVVNKKVGLGSPEEENPVRKTIDFEQEDSEEESPKQKGKAKEKTPVKKRRTSQPATELSGVIQNLMEQTNESAKIVLHALYVCSGYPSIALRYLQGKETEEDNKYVLLWFILTN